MKTLSACLLPRQQNFKHLLSSMPLNPGTVFLVAYALIHLSIVLNWKSKTIYNISFNFHLFEPSPSCTKCGNEAHVNKNTCPATGRRCLKCGRLNHFACVFKGAANDRKDKRVKAVECEQQTNTHSVSQDDNFLEDVYLYQQKGRKITESNCHSSHQWHSYQSTPGHAGGRHGSYWKALWEA